MSNSEEQRLRQRVLEHLRRDPDNLVSSGDLYLALGGQKVLRYTETEFREFLRNSCSFVEEQESKGDENRSPKYALQDTLRRKRTSVNKLRSASSSHISSDKSRKGFTVQKDGFRAIICAARRLSETSGDGTIVWNELRTNYRKETGRHLTVDELNNMLGTKNLTKFQILTTKLSGIMEPVDNKGLILRLVNSRSLSSPSPMRVSSVSSNGSTNSDHTSPPRSNQLSATSPQRSPSEIVESASPKTEPCLSTVSENKNEAVSVSAYESNSDVLTQETIVRDVKLREKAPISKDVLEGDDDVFTSESNAELNTQTHFENDEETVNKFAESLIQHRNSLPDEFGDEIYGGEDVNVTETINAEKVEDSTVDKSQFDESSIALNEQSDTSTGMNAAFIADDSLRTSFFSPMNGSATTFETSGEHGYTTCSEQLSDAACDISLNMSCAESVDPPTPRRTHEITLCSSRNGTLTDMPDPDISPLCSASHSLDSPSIFNSIREEKDAVTPESVVEPVPLPRKTVSIIPVSVPSEPVEDLTQKTPLKDQSVIEVEQSPAKIASSTELDPIKAEQISENIKDVVPSEPIDNVVQIKSATPVIPLDDHPVVEITPEKIQPDIIIVQGDSESSPVPLEPFTENSPVPHEPFTEDSSVPQEAFMEKSSVPFDPTTESSPTPAEPTANQSRLLRVPTVEVTPADDDVKVEEPIPSETMRANSFIEEVSIVTDTAHKEDPVNKSCTFIEEYSILNEDYTPSVQSTVSKDVEAEPLTEDSTASDDTEELEKPLCHKSESVNTVIEQPLTLDVDNKEIDNGEDESDIQYDNDESSNSSSPVKTVTVEVELKPNTDVETVPTNTTFELQLQTETTEVELKKEIPEAMPEEDQRSPVDDEPSREPSVISREDTEKQQEPVVIEREEDRIDCLSPEAELPQQGLLVDKQHQDPAETDSKRKNKKRTRIVAPRRRIFDCCTVL